MLLAVGTVACAMLFMPTSPEDPVLLVARACFLVLTIVICIRLLHSFETDSAIIWIVMTGIVIRWIYTAHTPFDVRAHDAHAHLQYIRFMAEHWSLPPAGGGWEYFQPPLYYALMALPYRVGSLIGWTETLVFVWLQQISFFLSALTLVISAWIGRLVLPGVRNHMPRLLLAGFAAALPGLILFSSRLSNDVLITPLVFFGTALLLRWWKDGSDSVWLLIWLTAAVAFLTKLNGIVLIPSAVFCMLLKKRSPIRKRLQKCLAGFCLLFILTFWLPAVRLTESSRDIRNLMEAGTVGLNQALRVTRSPEDFFRFNPGAMIAIPFNNPWSNAARRSHYPEYVFRSALFGEFRAFDSAWLAPGLTVFALLLLPWMFRGMVESVRSTKENLPLLIMTTCVFGLGIVYTLRFPYAQNQDFRYMPLIGLTAAYWIALGIEHSGKLLQVMGTVVLAGFCLLSAWFMMA